MSSMKRILSAALLAAAAQGAMATDVGVSIGIGDPNFYGRIDIGNFPRPVLMYPNPVVIRPAPYAAAPLYLRVPPAMPATGGVTAGATMPAACRSISCRTAGIATSMLRATGPNTVAITTVVTSASTTAATVGKIAATTGAPSVSTSGADRAVVVRGMGTVTGATERRLFPIKAPAGGTG